MRGWFCEVRRIFTSHRIYLSMIGVAAALFFSLESDGLRNSVLETYLRAVILSGYLLCYSFAAYAYGTIFCEELEHRYLYYELMREGLKRYVVKKTLMIYISSVFAIIAGTMVFGFVCRIFLPWEAENGGAYYILAEGVYGQLLVGKHYIWYLVFNALHMGMFAGQLSLAAALFSLFITNRIMVLSFPVLLVEILYLLPGKIRYTDFFRGIAGVFDKQWMNVAVSVSISAAAVLLLTILIYKVLQSRL